MSPELLSPQQFDFRGSRPTRHLDCYALGMVVYEVLSGRLPFYQYADWVVFGHVVEGKRPWRPQGVEGSWFTDDVWGVLEHCWMRQPDSRPSIKGVL
jgi:serine/threonine protein kinase